MSTTPTPRSSWSMTSPSSRSTSSAAAVNHHRVETRCNDRLMRRALQQVCERAAARGVTPVQVPVIQEDPSIVEQDVIELETKPADEAMDELAVLRAVVADAAVYFRTCLVEPIVGRRARRALAARKLPILTAADGIGYAPEGGAALTTHLQGLGYTDEHLLAAGVSIRRRTTHLIDRFRARITFAVHDGAGDVVAFTARAFDEDRAAAAAAGHDLPKYLNTCETALYRKREVLYGLTPQVRRLLGTGAVPVLAEGPTDALAITLAGAGRYVGIASCGTALTSEHLDVLDDVLQATSTSQDEAKDTKPGAGYLGRQGLAVAFDCDKAGRGTARRAFGLAVARGLRLLEVTLPEGGDPASLPRTTLAGLLEHVQDTPLVLSLIRDAVAPWAGRLHEDASQLNAVRAAVRFIDPVHDDLDMGRCLAAVAAATGADAVCVVDELLDHRTSTSAA